MSKFAGAFASALDGIRGNAIGVSSGGQWYWEVPGRQVGSVLARGGPFASKEEAKKDALSKGYDW